MINKILLLFAVFMGLLNLWFSIPLDSSDLKAGITDVSSHYDDKAKDRLKLFLTAHPAPTNGEWYQFKRELDDLAVLEFVEKSTGNLGLVPPSRSGALPEITDKQSPKQDERSNLPFSEMVIEEKLIFLVSKAFWALIALSFGLSFLSFVLRARNGR